ncbi:hypothetical protein AB4225_19760 [Streptomyces sp. 2RAF24]|uniref:hypothetical protein n=1 Tax=Streptomyces sp. 2RAF24 TaxID=3232997 RepID=UPI003F954350
MRAYVEFTSHQLRLDALHRVLTTLGIDGAEEPQDGLGRLDRACGPCSRRIHAPRDHGLDLRISYESPA